MTRKDSEIIDKLNAIVLFRQETNTFAKEKENYRVGKLSYVLNVKVL